MSSAAHIRHVAAVSLFCVAVLATSAMGQSTGKPAYDPRAAFQEADSNQDGAVDHEEFVDRMAEVFFRADTNKDGALSPAECSATLVQTENLSVADSNHDGQLTMHEFMRARLMDYEAVDANHDGLLELDEVVTVFEQPKK